MVQNQEITLKMELLCVCLSINADIMLKMNLTKKGGPIVNFL